MTRDEAQTVIDDLFDSWYPCVLRYATRLTGDLEAAEDVVEEAFLLLYQEPQFRPAVENPNGWMITVVRRRAGRQIELSRLSPDLLDTVELANLAAISPSDPFETQLLNDDARKLMAVLTPRESEIIFLRLSSMKYREIAEELGVSLSAVNTLLARALRKLQIAAGQTPETKTVANDKDESVSKTLQ
jgi:RNA polymerase sigma-70 factor (ECF subfamily)